MFTVYCIHMCKNDWLLENHFVKDNLPHRLSNRTTSKVVTTGTKKADEIHGRHASPLFRSTHQKEGCGELRSPV